MKMLKLILPALAFWLVAGLSSAQVLPGGPANIAGTLYASNFAQWSVPMGNNGPLSWSYYAACNSQTSGGVTFKPFVVGSPIRIVDVNPSLSETVTVTSVRPAGSGCQIQVNPSNPHDSFTLQSATAGLQEAINFAGSQNYLIYTTPDFTRLGGTTSTITNAKGSTAAPILDFRTQVPVPYSWNGTNYVAGSLGGGGVSSVNTTGYPPLTGAVVFACGSGLACTQTGNTVNIAVSAPVTPLTITSFTGGQALELGQSVVNPTFAAAYTGTPTSANITNTDAIDTPHNLSSPYTAATLSGTFVHTSTATTTFTLHASDGTNNPTATQTFTWNPAIFGGVGATGATSAVTASGTTAVLSTGDALPRAQLGAETVGEQFGPYFPTGQNVYLLLTGGFHTFTDACSGFPFAFNAPIAVTFVNANGVSVGMFLYGSTNPLTGSGCGFKPTVAS